MVWLGFKINNLEHVQIEKIEKQAPSQGQDQLRGGVPVERAGLCPALPLTPRPHHHRHFLCRRPQLSRHSAQGQAAHRHNDQTPALHLPPLNIQAPPQPAIGQPPAEDGAGGGVVIGRGGPAAGLPNFDRGGRVIPQVHIQLRVVQ